MRQAAGGADTGDGQVLRTGPTRRRLFTVTAGAAAGLLISGCKGIQALGTPPPPAPDIRALRRAITTEKALVDRYAAAIAGAGGTGGVLAALQSVHAEHVAHLAQLTGRLREPAGQAHTPSPATSLHSYAGGGGSGGGGSSVLLSLERAEQAASDQLLGGLASLPPSLAQLFASIAASEATHVPYLHAAGAAK